MSDIATAVREGVKRMKKSAKVQNEVKIAKKVEKTNFITIFLGVLIMLMTILTTWVLVEKTGVLKSMGQATMGLEINEKITVERETVVKNPKYLAKAEAEARFGKIDSQVSDLEKQFKAWSYRSWVTAIVVNENAHMAHEVDRRYHSQYQPDYMKLDKDWKASRLPKYQSLTDKQKEDIKRGSFR